jgi:hypothetical protein
MPAKLTRLKDSVVDPRQQWTRRKLQVLFAVAVVVVLALVGGGVWSMVSMSGSDPSSVTERALLPGGETAQDQLASEPLSPASLEQAQPGTLSTGRTGTLQIPAPTRIGAANVPSGFAHTPEGALAQLIAIDQTAIAPASVKTAQLVIDNWAGPGGPTSATWSGVKAVATLLSSAALPADGSGGLTVTLEPAMGFIKGSVGVDFEIPCVDFVITASMQGAAAQRIAAVDCQRMVWSEDRWVVGPGKEPAPAPSLWPGTQESFDAGYQWLEVAP